MNSFTQSLSKELETCGLIPTVEYKVKNLVTNEVDYLEGDFYFQGNSARCDIDSLYLKELVAERFHIETFKTDDSLCLDEHLQELDAQVRQAIHDCDLFDLID